MNAYDKKGQLLNLYDIYRWVIEKYPESTTENSPYLPALRACCQMLLVEKVKQDGEKTNE